VSPNSITTGMAQGNANSSPNIELLCSSPNPASGKATFAFSVKEGGTGDTARLSIFDIAGRRVAKLEEKLDGPGEYGISWDSASVAAGVYLYKLEVGSDEIVKKMVVR